MPRAVRPLSQWSIIADLRRDVDRLRLRSPSQQVIFTHDTFTAAGTPSTTYPLTYLPTDGSVLLAKQGLVLREGTDYTVDGTTGIVTVTASQTAGDQIVFRYATTGELIANTAPVDSGPITDTFNRANSSSLGTTSDGSATWTDLSGGQWTILSNKAHCIGGAGSLYVAVVDTGHADGTLALDVTQISSSIATGLAFRVTDSANNYNVQILSGAGASGVYRYGGGATLVGSAFTAVLGDVVSIVMAGTSVTVQVNGSTVTSFTDSTYTTRTKHGIIATGGIDVDNFNWSP